MRLHSVVLNFCLVSSILCLGLPYLLAGYLWIGFIFLGIPIMWFILNRRSRFWSSSSLLFASVLLAAMGIIINLPFPWMVAGCTASLAAWDLTNFRQGIPANPSIRVDAPLERYRLISLGGAAVGGLLIVFISSQISLQISFGITVLLILIAAGCLTLGLQSVIKSH